jgi:glycosyltransferase involved in cell wall biosynthesis
MARSVVALVGLLRRYRVDVVHTHLFFANVCGRLAAWAGGVPAVVTSVHNADYANEDTGRWRFKLRKLSDMMTAQWMNSAVLAVSEAVREDCRRHLGLRNVEVLHNWIDADEFTAVDEEAMLAARREFGFSRDDWVLINVAKLRRQQKGQQYLIHAMPEIAAVIPRARLLLVGEGPDGTPLQELARNLGLEGIIVFAGQRRDIPDLLAMADVFVFPSVYEGFGIALVEAMAMAKPVVASRLEGILEIVTDGVDGLLVEPRSPQAIARAVIRLYNDGALTARLGAAASRTVRERFSVKVGISRLETIYASLVNNHRSVVRS